MPEISDICKPETGRPFLMTDPTPYKVGGVPEHFNLPWHLAIEAGAFQEQGVRVAWHDYPGGTGAMTNALVEGDLDIAVALSEGIAARIIQGHDLQILQNYVTSPLTWGVFVAADASFDEPYDLKDQTFAVSRMGSGSHLMAYVYAQQHNWELSEDQLHIASNLEGMANALSQHEADVLLWEKFTAKPYAESGQIQLFDETTPPWPAFALVTRRELAEQKPEELGHIQQVINQYNQQFMADQQAIDKLTNRYAMVPADAQEWFGQTHWATDSAVSRADLSSAVDTLYQLNLVSRKQSPDSLCADLAQLTD
jgi:ABC-type nitrate/sulfonate/bicarbonate transport system substrate-binding protein